MTAPSTSLGMTSQAAKPRQHFAVLDGWRGITALWIALFHLQIASDFLTSPLVRNSYIVVDFFFVLSGFVITHTYGSRLATAAQLGDFVVRRLARVWPLHILLLLAFAGIEILKTASGSQGAPFAEPYEPATFLANLVMLTSMGLTDHTSWNFPAWSISAEFWTYVAFAATVVIAVRTRSKLLDLFATLMLLGVTLVITGSQHGMDVSHELGLYRCFYGFFLGCLTYRLWQRTEGRLHSLSWAEIPAVVGLVGFVWIVGQSWIGFLAPLVSAIIVFIFAMESGPVSRLMRHRVVEWLGQRSYTIYMVHVFVAVNLIVRPVQILENRLQTPLTATYPSGERVISLPSAWMEGALTLAYVGLVLALAAVLYRWFERPAQAWLIKRLTKPGRARAAAPVTPSPA